MGNDDEFLLPNSHEAERAVLGAILIENRCIRPAQETLKQEDFYREPHRKIFRAMLNLFARATAIDTVTLKEELFRSGELDEVGGPAYIGSLVDGVPRSANIEYYARIVKEKAVERAAILHVDSLREAILGRSGAAPGEARESIIARGEAAREAIDWLMTSAIVEALPTLDLSASPPPVPDPLIGDDSHQVLMPGEISLIASDPGVGKTKLTTEISLAVASGGDCLGMKTRQQPVVMVTSDGDPDLERNLYRQWAGRGGDRPGFAALPLHVVSNDDFCLEDPDCYARLQKTMEKVGARNGPVILILESLATNVRETDLNDQVAVRQFVRMKLRSLMRRFPDLTVVVTCHLRKSQQGSVNDLGTRIAGSVQIRGAVDCVIGLVPAGRDAFTVRRIKRSRSGGNFEAFKVQILGERTEPIRLQNEGNVDVSLEELRGAARAVIDAFRRTGGPKTVDELAVVVQGFGKRAIQGACKRLAEAEKPPLVRVSKKPAKYDLAPETTDPDLGGLD